MAILKAGISGLKDGALIAKSRNVVAQLTAHVATFAAPNPALADVTAVISALESAKRDAETGSHLAYGEVRATRTALKGMMNQLAEYVANVAAGDETIMLQAGFEARKKPERQPLPEAPTSLIAMVSAYQGAVDLQWVSAPYRSYVVMMASTDPAQAGAEWQAVATTTKRRHTVDQLEPGKMYWFQVKAVNAAGEGPASEYGMSRAAY